LVFIFFFIFICKLIEAQGARLLRDERSGGDS
jgi:hypothetical protein